MALMEIPNRFRFLMSAILLMILLRPFLEELAGVTLLTDLFFAGILLSGVYAAQGGKYSYWPALILAGLSLTARGARHFAASPILESVSEGSTALFFVLLLVKIGAYIRTERKVTLDVIFAAVSAYLMLGLIFAEVCRFLEELRPGSFRLAEPGFQDSWEFLYYSFVTLTTLGYGDIVAVSKPARSLAILEAVVGQLYLAVLIGRLVGAYSAELREDVKGKD